MHDISDTEILKQNMAELEQLSKRLGTIIGQRKLTDPNLMGPGQSFFDKTFAAIATNYAMKPELLIEQQVGLWQESLENYISALSTTDKSAANNSDNDRRFKNPLWQNSPYFRLAREQYLLAAKSIHKNHDSLEGLAPSEKKQLEFFGRQLTDMMAPSNFLGTNPDALQLAFETKGKSLVNGLKNLISDLEKNDGEISVTLADPDAFELGKNIATTDGSVIFKNRMFELIQYTAKTKTVYSRPLLIFPPWINKFYILDLKAQNSFIQFAVSQGFTVFVVSWINPDRHYRDVGIETYVKEGSLTAVDTVLKITNKKKLNAIGYCIGGTLLTITLAHMAAAKDKRIKSATFFTTLTDFENAGELGVYIDDSFLSAISKEVNKSGILKSNFMAKTFSSLRANDLIYAPAIRSYMMGQPAPAFDLLYWNSDGTNLPAKMTKEYLFKLYKSNMLSNGTFKLDGKKLKLDRIKLPVFGVACESDHIAPWQSSFTGLSKFGGKKRYILAESGHIAGIINPPNSGKYGYWVNKNPFVSGEEWKKHAQRHTGSWWGKWAKWLAKRSGKQIHFRSIGNKTYPPLHKAPGRYVLK